MSNIIDTYMTNITAEAIGARLRFLRKLLKLTREELALRSKISRASISYWEHARVNSPIKQKSLNKLISTFKEMELEVTEKWLKEGVGSLPRYKGELIAVNNTTQTALPNFSLSHNLPIKVNLSTSFVEEIKLFSSIDNTIITKINDSNFSPFFEKHDLAGGIWQKANLIEKIAFCIIQFDQQININLIDIYDDKNNFKIYLNFDDLKKDKFYIRSLDVVAPIIRLWR